MVRKTVRPAGAIFLLILTFAAAEMGRAREVRAQEAHEPQVKPTLAVGRAAGPIEIDGDLDDPGWVGAARVGEFTEFNPDENDRPPVETEALIAYDDTHLYVAILAHDDPALLRTSIRQRDETGQDDYVGIILDTYGDASWGYLMFVNPSGVQTDTRYTAQREDVGFDVVFESESRITADGYQIEIAIPFESLRFPDQPEQTWRATFWRNHPRGSRGQYSWAAISRDDPCLLCQLGTLTGIRGIESGGALELFPAVVASRSSDADEDDPLGGDLKSEGFDGEASLGLRYAFPQGLTAEATFNPDFSQVESDVAQIDVNETFALFFPERRPFFQEGSDLFESYFTPVYTRRINDPDAAVKLIGRLGRTSVAYLAARDETSPILLPFEQRSFVEATGHSFSNIARVHQSYGASSYIGGVLTDRRMDEGGSGTLYGLDGAHRFRENYRIEYQLLGSRTVEPEDAGPTSSLEGFTFGDDGHTAIFDGESFSGFAQYTSFEREARRWSFDVDYWSLSPTFRAANGFESRNDMRRVSMSQSLNFYPQGPWLDQIGGGLFVQRRWTYGGDQRSDFVVAEAYANLARQTFVGISHEWDQEKFGGINFEGIRNWEIFVESDLWSALRVGFGVEHGESIARNADPPILGEGTDYEAFANLRPIPRLSIEPSIVYSSLHAVDTGEEIFEGYIVRARTSFSLSRQLFLRLVLQFDDFDETFDVEPLVTYQLNPFSLFYLGSTQAFADPPGTEDFTPTSRQYFAKFQYLLRF